ncbi:MAG: phosphatase PAP2 family protein [Pseudobdellovibrio sp.]
MDFILKIDHKIFYYLNSQFTNSAFDWFFPLWTNIHKNKIFMAIFIPLVLWWCFKKWRAKGGVVFILACLLTAGADVVVGFLKPLFDRLRPVHSNLPFEVVLRGSPQGGLSFPSGHATDAFFLATFLAVFYPQGRKCFYILAFLTAYSRVYCGVHYPSDVLCGSILGIVLGLIAGYSVRLLYKTYIFKKQATKGT